MNVFLEFHKIVLGLQAAKVKYAVIGGVAMAFHSYARFTQDIDILIKGSEMDQIREILKKEGYELSSKPWRFSSQIELHRFLKIDEDGDEMIIDIMVSENDRHDQVIEDALEAYSEHTGMVRVARREDLIWLKSQRNSPIDQADIEILKNEKEND
jgi:hypothetical protein